MIEFLQVYAWGAIIPAVLTGLYNEPRHLFSPLGMFELAARVVFWPLFVLSMLGPLFGRK